MHVETEDDDGASFRMSDDTSTNDRRHKKLKSNKTDKLEAFMEKWISIRSEEAELKNACLKEKLARLQRNSSTSESSATDLGPYSHMACLDILNSMTEVTNEVYVKAVKAFKDPAFRVTFVKMAEHRRLPVLELL